MTWRQRRAENRVIFPLWNVNDFRSTQASILLGRAIGPSVISYSFDIHIVENYRH